jgi:hypothetical protein
MDLGLLSDIIMSQLMSSGIQKLIKMKSLSGFFLIISYCKKLIILP